MTDMTDMTVVDTFLETLLYYDIAINALDQVAQRHSQIELKHEAYGYYRSLVEAQARAIDEWNAEKGPTQIRRCTTDASKDCEKFTIEIGARPLCEHCRGGVDPGRAA